MTDNTKSGYRLCAVDMDGTLLTSDNRITDATIDAIRAVSGRGIYFCLTTGRPPVAVMPYQRALGLDTPIIVYNGGRIVDPDGSETLFERTLDRQNALDVMLTGMEIGATMCLWAKDRLYANTVNERSEFYRQVSGAEMTVPGDILPLAGKNIMKIVMCGTPDEISRYQSAARERLGDTVSIASSGPEFLEFFDRRVSKGAALEKLCGILGIDVSETIAIGDSYNDEQLLRAAGLGIAMGNAPDEIKDICAEVTASNDEDGVRLVLEKYFL